jgi:hypothetical protein
MNGRYTLTLGFLRGKSGSAELISGPDTPAAVQFEKLEKLRAAGSHADYERIEIIDSITGINRGKTVRLTEPQKPFPKKDK